MNRKFVILATICITIIAINHYQALAQNTKNKSNGILEIIAVYPPNLVVFKPTEGKEIKQLFVSFQSTNLSLYTKIKVEKGRNITDTKTVYTDQSEIYAMVDFENWRNLHTLKYLSFKAKTIMFDVDGEQMYYDLEKSKWESSLDESDVENPLMAIDYQQVNAQNENYVSNGTLKILAVYAPHFIVVQPAEGIKFYNYTSYLISEKTKLKGKEVFASGISLDTDKLSNALRIVYTDISEIQILFDTPENFDAKKFMFVANGKTMLFDLSKSEWELVMDTGQSNNKKDSDITWQIENDTLFISGTGEIQSLHGLRGELAPWYNSRRSFSSVVIGNGITKVGKYSFSVNNNIRSIIIAESVTSIENLAFNGCYKISTVEVKSDVPPQIGMTVFSAVYNKAKLIVPVGAKSAYKADKFWSRFRTIEEK